MVARPDLSSIFTSESHVQPQEYADAPPLVMTGESCESVTVRRICPRRQSALS